jgi:hypothetical protein
VLIGGLLVIVAAAGYDAAIEWRTSSRLKDLIAGQSNSQAAATSRASRETS